MGNNPQQPWKRRFLGLNVIEGGILLVILGLIVGAVAISAIPMLNAARKDRAELDLKNLKGAFRIYCSKRSRYPSEAEGFPALVDAGALEALPQDPWHNDYLYRFREGTPVILSYGEDGAPGGAGTDADISVQLDDRPGCLQFIPGHPVKASPGSPAPQPPSLPAPGP